MTGRAREGRCQSIRVGWIKLSKLKNNPQLALKALGLAHVADKKIIAAENTATVLGSLTSLRQAFDKTGRWEQINKPPLTGFRTVCFAFATDIRLLFSNCDTQLKLELTFGSICAKPDDYNKPTALHQVAHAQSHGTRFTATALPDM